MDENPSNTKKAEAPAEPVVAETAAPEAGKAKAPAADKPEEKKKSKKKLIIGIICAVAGVGIIAGGAVAIANVVMNQGDAVTRAISKLARGDGAKFFHIDGRVWVDGLAIGISKPPVDIYLDYDATFGTDSTRGGEGSATLTVSPYASAPAELGFSAKIVPDDGYYVKITGMNNIPRMFALTVGDIIKLDLESAAKPILSIVSTYDDKWLSVSQSTLEQLTKSASTSSNEAFQCIVSTVKRLPSYSDEIISYYKKNPYITSSTDNLGIIEDPTFKQGLGNTEESNTIYRLGVDAKKFVDFVNEVEDSQFVKDILACTGRPESSVDADEITVEKVESLLSENTSTAVYVEIDDNDNFTRFITTDGEKYAFILNIDYLDSINVTKPLSSVDLMTAVQDIFMKFQGQGTARSSAASLLTF